MFIVRNSTGGPREPTASAFADLGWAHGFVYPCDQSALMFGNNRMIPVAFRPVVSMRKDGARAVVLPCTTKDHSTNPEFFELVNEVDVHWTKPWDGRRSFASRRYEVLDPSHLRKGIGVMPQSARIRLAEWFKERW